MRFEGFRASDKISVQQLVTFHCVSRLIPALEINRLCKGKEKLNKEPESEVSGLCLLFSQKAEKESGRSIPAGERVLQGQDQKSSNILKNERGGSDGTA